MVHHVLVMSVNPGFGGQEFIEFSLDKIRRLAELRQELGLAFRIEVDGGVAHDTVAASSKQERSCWWPAMPFLARGSRSGMRARCWRRGPQGRGRIIGTNSRNKAIKIREFEGKAGLSTGRSRNEVV
jgi:hypothetical protein